MIWILLAIFCSTWIVMSFKIFEKFRLDFYQVIVFNYLVCVGTNWATEGSFPFDMAFLQSDKSTFALGLGLVFILSFNAVALTVSRVSVTIASILQKMTIIATTAFAWLFYGEQMQFLKFTGILLAIGAIVITNIRQQNKTAAATGRHHRSWELWLLPVFTFVSCCLVDLGIVYSAKTISGGNTDPQMIAAMFGGAGVLGLAGMVAGILAGKIQFNWQCILAGIALGVPNYGALYFISQAFASGLDVSIVFPVVNMGTICLVALAALYFFKEQLSKLNWAGVGLALLSIALISFS